MPLGASGIKHPPYTQEIVDSKTYYKSQCRRQLVVYAGIFGQCVERTEVGSERRAPYDAVADELHGYIVSRCF